MTTLKCSSPSFNSLFFSCGSRWPENYKELMTVKKSLLHRTLPTGVEIPVEDDFIWKAYNDRCVFHPRTYAVCLHEEPPKSQNPYWRLYPENRFPVCEKCHERMHQLSRIDAMTELLTARMKNFPDAVKTIDAYMEEKALGRKPKPAA